MDIQQLKYFLAVVDHGYNITRAASALHISQPALSKAILVFEHKFGFHVFQRDKGRLVDLTVNGQIIQQKARELVKHFDELMELANFRARAVEGSMLLGIPPLVISTLFSEFLFLFHRDHPQIKLIPVEYGGAKLEEMLKANTLDFAVSLSPTSLNANEFAELLIHEGDYMAFAATDNPLAHQERLSWQDLANKDLAIADSTFSSYHLIMEKIKHEGVQFNSMMTAHAWDYLFNTIRNSDCVTILPYIAQTMFNMHGVRALSFDDPLKWRVVLAYRQNREFSRLEQYVLAYVKNFYQTGQDNRSCF